jgi:hypothetical protein
MIYIALAIAFAVYVPATLSCERRLRRIDRECRRELRLPPWR